MTTKMTESVMKKAMESARDLTERDRHAWDAATAAARAVYAGAEHPTHGYVRDQAEGAAHDAVALFGVEEPDAQEIAVLASAEALISEARERGLVP